MIQKICFTKNNKDYVYTYSDKFVYIEREGEEYTDVLDPAEFNREYTETDKLLPVEAYAAIRLELEMLMNEEN